MLASEESAAASADEREKVTQPPSVPGQPVIQALQHPALQTPTSQQERQQRQISTPIFTVITQDINGGLQVTLNVSGTNSNDFAVLRTVSAPTRMQDEMSHAGFAAGRVRTMLSHWYRWISSTLSTTFLPAGYPKSCGENYMEYILWSGVTNFAVTANSVLASTFLLYSVGLGAGSIATAGALNWILKDGLGQLGTLAFGKVIAHNFDIHSKSWFFLSNVKLKIATALEMLTILSPEYFLVMGSVANCLKGLAWMANGSTRSVFNLSFAKDNNIADITAKSTSQWIFASLFGTAAGASMCTYVGQNVPLAMLCYSALTAATIFSSYKTVKSIPLSTLNSTRLQLLAQGFLGSVREAATAKARAQVRRNLSATNAEWDEDDMLLDDSQIEYDRSFDEELATKVPNPVKLASLDPPLAKFLGDERIMNPRIYVGGCLYDIVEGDPQLLVVLMTTFKYSHYVIIPCSGIIHVILHQAADPRDICQAYLQAAILRGRMKQGVRFHAGDLPELRIALQDSLLAAERLTTPFMAALNECGWRIEKVVVEAVRRRARW